MFFKLVKDLPWMFAIAFLVWLLVLILFLRGPNRKNGSFIQKNAILLLSVIIALVLTTADIWYFVQYAPTHFKRDITSEKSIILTATEIVKEFQANETLAVSKYNNKVVEITGEVIKVDIDSTSSTILLKTDVAGTSISSKLKSKQDIVSGCTVTVKGILTGFILNQVQLNEAIITNITLPSSTKAPLTVLKDSALSAVKSVKDTSKKAAEKKIEARIYTTNKASIRFFSSTPEEDIEATNSQTISSLNDKTGQLNVAALIKGFHFENDLMQNHFNDKDYMNSDAFPKSEFNGIISNINTVNFSKDGSYNVTATGSLTIHGATQKVTAMGTLSVNSGIITVKSVFKIKRVDYGITTNEVADVLEITVTAKYD
jgi:hypothetical protein